MCLALGDDEIFVNYNASDAVDFTDRKGTGFDVRFLRDARSSLCFRRIFRFIHDDSRFRIANVVRIVINEQRTWRHGNRISHEISCIVERCSLYLQSFILIYTVICPYTSAELVFFNWLLAIKRFSSKEYS